MILNITVHTNEPMKLSDVRTLEIPDTKFEFIDVMNYSCYLASKLKHKYRTQKCLVKIEFTIGHMDVWVASFINKLGIRMSNSLGQNKFFATSYLKKLHREPCELWG